MGWGDSFVLYMEEFCITLNYFSIVFTAIYLVCVSVNQSGRNLKQPANPVKEETAAVGFLLGFMASPATQLHELKVVRLASN